MDEFKTSKTYKVRFLFPKCLAARVHPIPSQKQGTGGHWAAPALGIGHLHGNRLMMAHGPMGGPGSVG